MNNKNVLFLVNESKDEKLVISKEIHYRREADTS